MEFKKFVALAPCKVRSVSFCIASSFFPCLRLRQDMILEVSLFVCLFSGHLYSWPIECFSEVNSSRSLPEVVNNVWICCFSFFVCTTKETILERADF